MRPGLSRASRGALDDDTLLEEQEAFLASTSAAAASLVKRAPPKPAVQTAPSPAKPAGGAASEQPKAKMSKFAAERARQREEKGAVNPLPTADQPDAGRGMLLLIFLPMLAAYDRALFGV